MDCGTELVFSFDEPDAVSDAAPSPVAPAPAAAKAPRGVSCPDCGEVGTPDDNGLCPVCGHDFGGRVEIDESEFFRDPPSLEEAMKAERKRLGGLQQASTQFGQAAAQQAASPSRSDLPLPGDNSAAESLPLPGDRRRARYQTGGTAAVPREVVALYVDGGQSVFFDGRMTSEIRLDVDQILIGRRDPAQGHYPDVDLGHFRHIDGHISRRHARIYRQHGQWYLEDLCENDATYLNDRGHVLNGETVALSDGDRVLISESVAMVLRIQRT